MKGGYSEDRGRREVTPGPGRTIPVSISDNISVGTKPPTLSQYIAINFNDTASFLNVPLMYLEIRLHNIFINSQEFRILSF